MSKKTKLINRKTGKEFIASDPEKVLKKYPNTFRTAPDPKISKEIEVKEAEIVDAKTDTTLKKSDKKNNTD